MYTSPILGFAGGNIDSGEERKTVEEQSKSMHEIGSGCFKVTERNNAGRRSTLKRTLFS